MNKNKNTGYFYPVSSIRLKTIGSLLFQAPKIPVPLPDYLYGALIDLYKNGLPPPGQRTVAQHEARIKKVRYLYLIPEVVKALIKMLILTQCTVLKVYFHHKRSFFQFSFEQDISRKKIICSFPGKNLYKTCTNIVHIHR